MELTSTIGFDWIALITLAIGLIGSVVVFSFKIGGVKNSIDTMGKDVGEIKNDLKDFHPKFSIVESRVNDMWSTQLTRQRSPRYLNEKGEKILRDSKVNELIEEHYDEILDKVRAKGPTNAYQAEQDLLEVVQSLVLDPECQNRIENAAFNTGQSVNTVLFIGAIFVRDRIIGALGLNVSDIDKHDPSKH